MPTTRSAAKAAAASPGGDMPISGPSSKITKPAPRSGSRSRGGGSSGKGKGAGETTTEGEGGKSNDTDDIVYFWRDTDTKTGWLSQWYPCAFKDDDGVVYASAEHYMMYQKAILFSSPLAASIVSPEGFATHPRQIKKVGRQIKNFSQPAWDANRLRIVASGSYFKFKNPLPEAEASATADSAGKGPKVAELGGLRKMLLDTGEREIVEASPMDRIWGIGLAEAGARKSVGRRAWGLNLLGVALVEARERLRAEEEEEEKEKGKEKNEGLGEKKETEKKEGPIEEDWVEVGGAE